MNKLFIALALVFTSTSYAFEVPPDAIIKVFDASGKQIGEMSRTAYKVVKIEDRLPAPVLLEPKLVVMQPEKRTKYSLILTGGEGYTTQDNGHVGGQFTVTQQRGLVGQATLCAEADTSGLCGTVSTNGFFGLGLLLPLSK